jgi:putative transposase
VAFTACVAGRDPLFSDLDVAKIFAAELGRAAARYACAVVVYCFMPDHLHVVLQGKSPEADLWRAMVFFKQRSGYWLKRMRPGVRWQKDFHDRAVRRDENLVDHLRYVVNNPVRAGLVEDWREYPCLGPDVFSLKELFSAA